MEESFEQRAIQTEDRAREVGTAAQNGVRTQRGDF